MSAHGHPPPPTPIPKPKVFLWEISAASEKFLRAIKVFWPKIAALPLWPVGERRARLKFGSFFQFFRFFGPVNRFRGDRLNPAPSILLL